MKAWFEYAKSRAQLGAVILLGLMTTLVDFTSKILSVAFDGVLQAVMVVVVAVALSRKKKE